MFGCLSDAAPWAAQHPATGLAAGLLLLIAGASTLVRGAVWIALVLGVSRMTVGLTLVAFGTSLPELLVSLTSAWHGASDIALANVIGSNTMNVLLIVGVSAAICPIRLAVDWLELGYMLVATALVGVTFATGMVDRPIAGAMVVMLALFCWQLVRRERRRGCDLDAAHVGNAPPRATAAGWALHLALIAAGFLLLKFGAEWLIDSAVASARSLGLSDALIGMTIVAGGTSLPELATSALAAKKGHPEIAIGNVVGSNIFNVGSVLGCCGLIQPLPAQPTLLPLMIATGISALWLVVLLRATNGVGRRSGAAFLLAYAGYIGWEAHRSGAF